MQTSQQMNVLFIVFMFCVAPVSSMMCERWGSRVTAVSGAFLSCIGISLSAFVSNLYVVYFTFGIIGGIYINNEYHFELPIIIMQ